MTLFAGESLPWIRINDKQSITGEIGYSTHSKGVSDSIRVTRFTAIRELTDVSQLLQITFID